MKSLTLQLAVLAVLWGIFANAGAETSSTQRADEQQPVSVLSFPREVQHDGATIAMHVPEIETWEDFEKVTGRIAVEVTPAGENEAVAGVVEFVADSDTNLEERVVAIDNTEITVTHFPVSDDKRRQQLDLIVRNTAKKTTQYLPLDVVLSYVAPEAPLPEDEGLSFEPPPIFHSTTPAVLMMTDGEPILAPIADTKLQYVLNTNWDLFYYKEKEWYLRDGRRWLKAKELKGPWEYDNSLPRDFKKLPDDANWTEVRASIPPAKGDSDIPTIFVSERPAELIVTDGQPAYGTITAAGLEYVRNTESDLFRLDGRFFYLVSGRWFGAASLRGPWHHVKELPQAFLEIPDDGPKGHVLAAVPGSEEARLAVLEASIPRKASISRNAGDNVTVTYNGDPELEPIPGTNIQRVVNSPNDVLLFEGVYYLCLDAVWYRSTSSTGPWSVADNIPAAIYSIPPSSPAYHVTHVNVYDSDDQYVSTGYTSGYYGANVSYGVVVYGSGWYYPPYYGYGYYYGYPYYPYYYAYPYSYGASAWYNPNTGMYGRSASVYGPYGGYGRGAAYNPKTGTYARGEAVWDSNEIAGRGVAYNPRTGTGVATNRYANEDGGWGESLITHNDKWVETRSEWDQNSRQTEFRTSEGTTGQINRERSGDTVTGSGEFQRGDQTLTTKSVRGPEGGAVGFQTGTGEQGVIARSAEGDLYAGKDGQVYRRDENGWSQRGDDGWNPVDVPEDRAAQIDQARSNATDRRGDFENRGSSEARANRDNRGATDAWANRSYDSSRNRGTYDAGRRNELDRSYNARNNGYQRYDRRSSANRSFQQRSRSRPRGGRRRR
jgi:hypothetical protein